MTILRSTLSTILLATSLAFAAATASSAADVTYAPGQRVGMVLPAGLAPAAGGFAGFESLDRRTKVVVIELPATAFSAVETALKAGQALPANIKGKPEAFDTAMGKGLLSRETATNEGKSARLFSLIAPAPTLTAYISVQIEDGGTNAYSDDAIRTMLASTSVRAAAPVEEQLSLLPYKLTELSNFKTVRTLVPGVAILLTDGNGDETDGSPYIVVSLVPGGASQAEDRARMAQQLTSSIPGLSNVRTTSAEPMRIGGIPGYETRIEATGQGSVGPVNMVQWLRFSGGATMRIIGSAKKDEWSESFTRFRAVRDGIEPK